MSTTLGFTNTKNPHKKVQLLSPAGNLHKLKIALQFGADAVYGGVSHFSLRNRASKNFSYEDFIEEIHKEQEGEFGGNKRMGFHHVVAN